VVPFADGASPPKKSMQNFSIELSKKLSELVPNIGEHAYDWVVKEKGNEVGCTEHLHRQIICPAWQVEDVMRNSFKIFGEENMGECKKIACLLVKYPDTAYQKIEEYLLSIIK
jgi:hypothetical protein